MTKIETIKAGIKTYLDKATEPEEIQSLTELMKTLGEVEADDLAKASLIERQAQSMKDLLLNTPIKGEPNKIEPTPEAEPAPLSFEEALEQTLNKERSK